MLPDCVNLLVVRLEQAERAGMRKIMKKADLWSLKPHLHRRYLTGCSAEQCVT